MTSPSKVSVNTMKCIRPFVPIADIAFTENRLPGRRTTGVHPLAPQVMSQTPVRDGIAQPSHWSRHNGMTRSLPDGFVRTGAQPGMEGLTVS
ncbi:hypothetical protein ADL12_02950 [Streptomyces regalis]|uniref:Uncharacterized protein n=1 Tax=Streptomyces regalis TaxID=68262 RepID=A0A0X3VM67_9ACTN|nr:hypothetical protein ADL12_02950 [Streptomyces regalis]